MDRNLIDKNYRKANDQLFLIGCRKIKIKKDLYSLYDSYLKTIRLNLYSYIREAVLSIADISNKVIKEKNDNINSFLNKDLKEIVNEIFPFLTIEQLSIKNKFIKECEIKNNNEFKNNYDLKEEFCTSKYFEPISKLESIFYCNQYYKKLIDEDKFINIDINNLNFKNIKNNNNLEFIKNNFSLNVEYEDQFTIQVIQNQNEKNSFPNELIEIINWLETIDSSLNIYLKKLSLDINNQLFIKKIYKKYIDSELLLYIFDNHLLFINPLPFVLLFDLTFNEFTNLDDIYEDNKYSKLYLVNIDNTELEFRNMNLNSLRNKISELKDYIILLIKKEKYWSNKIKVNLNKSNLINKY